MKKDTKSLVLLGVLTAIELVFLLTPIGTVPIGPLSISLGMIPVAIAAIALGPIGGLILGSVFGIMSFLQCFGIGVPSGMGAILAVINPVLAFVQRFFPRAIDGFLVGLIYQAVAKLNKQTACFVAGFSAAFLNTVLFMSSLVLLFGNTEYVQGLMAGRNVIAFIVAFVGINAVVEMVASTIVTGLVGVALIAAKLIGNDTGSKPVPKAA